MEEFASKNKSAKYNIGVGPWPISITSQPDEISPSIKCLDNSSDDILPSLQTTTLPFPLFFVIVPKVKPIENASALNKVIPTTPLMS